MKYLRAYEQSDHDRDTRSTRWFLKWTEVAWAGSVILFGLLLLVYSE